ncbi:MAG TPA: alpha-(1-_3)-arabinofuranosyltransferase family protein, partial [Acidimicrobiia bacterium]
MSRLLGSRRRRSALGYSLLALLAYVPPLLTAPGRVGADTKQYLYLDPGRLLARSVSMWDPHVGMGTVTHQTIGYAFPMGPYYWLLDQIGSPAWVSQRLWLGSLLFAAAFGVLYLLRTFGLRGPGVVVAALA